MHTWTNSRDIAEDSSVVDRAIPVIDRVLRRRCRNWIRRDDVVSDLRSEAVVRVLARLRESVAPAAASIENFDSYVAGIATRVVDDAIRLAHPEWARLKNRVRYLVTHDSRFRVDDETQTVVLLAPSMRTGRGRVASKAADQLAAGTIEALMTAGGVLALDQLVHTLAERAGISRQPFRVDGESAASAAESPAAGVETADGIWRLWSEIALLPPRQRAALLLHARDNGGESVLRLFCTSSLVSLTDAAAALEIALPDFPALLDQLPLSDAAIGRRLGVAVQQVINLRKAARDRLARRLSRRR